jgi:hypothetical protein
VAHLKRRASQNIYVAHKKIWSIESLEFCAHKKIFNTKLSISVAHIAICAKEIHNFLAHMLYAPPNFFFRF